MPTPSSAPLLRCEALEVGYRGRSLLPPFSIEIGRGEFLSVIGRNGTGKTTLFRTLLGLLPPVGGRIEHPSGPLRVIYIGQRLSFDDLVPVTVRQVVQMGAESGWSFASPLGREVRGRVDEALAAVDAAELAGRTFRSLSEGQKQRVLLARMVAARADLALLDEPTAAMDRVAEGEAMDLVDALRDRYGTAVVIVSHHLTLTQRRADRVLLLDRAAGQVVEGTPAEVFSHPVFVARYGAMPAEVSPG